MRRNLCMVALGKQRWNFVSLWTGLVCTPSFIQANRGYMKPCFKKKKPQNYKAHVNRF